MSAQGSARKQHSTRQPLFPLLAEIAPEYAESESREAWETPWPLFRALDAEFGFTVDVAADESNHKLERWFEGPCIAIREQCACGICSEWGDEICWSNPPYGALNLVMWTAKYAEAVSLGATVVALLPVSTSTDWFEQVFRAASEIRLLKRRVAFVGSTSNNTTDSMLAIYRPLKNVTVRPGPALTLWDWRGEV